MGLDFVNSSPTLSVLCLPDNCPRYLECLARKVRVSPLLTLLLLVTYWEGKTGHMTAQVAPARTGHYFQRHG